MGIMGGEGSPAVCMYVCMCACCYCVKKKDQGCTAFYFIGRQQNNAFTQKAILLAGHLGFAAVVGPLRG